MPSSRFDRDGATFFQRMLAPLSTARELISDAVFGGDGIRTGERNPVIAALTFPIRFLWAFLVFMVQAWTTSRSGLAFIKGLPAMGCFALAPALAYLFTAYDRPVSMVPAVVNHAKYAESGEDNPAAVMFARKLVEIRPKEAQFKYMLAEDLARDGKNRPSGSTDGGTCGRPHARTIPRRHVGSPFLVISILSVPDGF